MNPEHNRERRAARAKAMVELHAELPGTRYVDAAEYRERGAFTAVVIDAKTGGTITAASVRTKEARCAEEVAIALTISDPDCKTVLCDSKSAVRNYAKNRVCCGAVRVLAALDLNKRAVTVKWFPAHAGNEVSKRYANHNETAHSTARELTGRAAVANPSAQWWGETKDRLATYHDITKHYRLSRRRMAPPDPSLTREQAVVFRQMQTGSLLTPVIMKHVCPEQYEDDTCKVCHSARATAAHLLWDCAARPSEAATATTIPPWFEAAARSNDKDEQLQAVQVILAALERQKPVESREGPAPHQGRLKDLEGSREAAVE